MSLYRLGPVQLKPAAFPSNDVVEGQRNQGSDCHQDPAIDAARLGLEIIEGRGDLLQFDIDKGCEFLYGNFDRFMGESNLVYRQTSTVSKSGNSHVYVLVDKRLPEITRIALQACFGSDRTRETFGMVRALRCRPLDKRHRPNVWRTPSVLFETPAEAVKIRAWLAEDHFGYRALRKQRLARLVEIGTGLLFVAATAASIHYVIHCAQVFCAR